MGQRVVLERQDFEAAWRDLQPILQTMLEKGVINIVAGHLAVVDRTMLGGGSQLRDSVVFERSLEPEQWGDKRPDIAARTKSYMAARDKESSRLVVRDGKPREGDFLWPGGIYMSGYGWGWSGDNANIDEMIVRTFIGLTFMHAYNDEERNPTTRPLPGHYFVEAPLEDFDYDPVVDEL